MSAYDEFLATSSAVSTPSSSSSYSVPATMAAGGAPLALLDPGPAMHAPQMTYKAPAKKKRKRAASTSPRKSTGNDKLLKCKACDLNNDAEYVHPELNVSAV